MAIWHGLSSVGDVNDSCLFPAPSAYLDPIQVMKINLPCVMLIDRYHKDAACRDVNVPDLQLHGVAAPAFSSSYICTKVVKIARAIGPKNMPTKPKRCNPPRTPIRTRMGCTFPLSPISFGRRILSIVETISQQ